jgi:hypothetical protein
MFQMIQERKNAVSSLPNQTDTSQTDKDIYKGEWLGHQVCILIFHSVFNLFNELLAIALHVECDAWASNFGPYSLSSEIRFILL